MHLIQCGVGNDRTNKSLHGTDEDPIGCPATPFREFREHAEWGSGKLHFVLRKLSLADPKCLRKFPLSCLPAKLSNSLTYTSKVDIDFGISRTRPVPYFPFLLTCKARPFACLTGTARVASEVRILVSSGAPLLPSQAGPERNPKRYHNLRVQRFP